MVLPLYPTPSPIVLLEGPSLADGDHTKHLAFVKSFAQYTGVWALVLSEQQSLIAQGFLTYPWASLLSTSSSRCLVCGSSL